MKRYALFLLSIIILLPFLAITVTPVIAGEKTELPCEEILVGSLDPGEWTFPDGNIHIRGMVNYYRAQSPDPRLDGYNTIATNANWQGDWTGPMWGTFTLETSDGGWNGTWTGQMTEMGPVLHGSGNGFGAYTGMKMWVDEGYGSCTNVIMEP